MVQLFPVNKNQYVQRYLDRMQHCFMSNPELYFDPMTGELFNICEPINIRLVTSVNPGNYPVYKQDEYTGYVKIKDREIFITKEEACVIWKER